MRLNPILALSFALAASGLAGCYGAEFDAEASDAHYCAEPSDCTGAQACVLARCVSDVGPHLEITGPEPLAEVGIGAGQISVVVQGNDLSFTDGDGHTDGEGFIQVELDGEVVIQRIHSGDLSTGVGETIDTDGLSPGVHRLRARALFGDGEAYENPSSEAWGIFFIDDGAPHVAIVDPAPGALHLVDEDLTIKVASINFDISQSGDDCTQEQVDNMVCEEVSTSGHNHVYMLPDYPSCLDVPEGEVSCNSKYVASLRPQTDEAETMELAEGIIEADRFEELGETPIAASLQYNNHDPWPSPSDPEYDLIDIQVVDR